MDYAAIQQRLDNVDRRLDRIERRLDLVGGIGTPASCRRPGIQAHRGVYGQRF
jgi:hypothetical protein